MKNFLAGLMTAFLMSGGAVAFAQYGVNYVAALAAVSPSGKAVLIRTDEEGHVICAR
jgi:hypothetical protein